MKIGILFSGQGSQYPGMGSDLYENCEPAKQIFEKAGDNIKSWCFDGTKEMLRQTHITQPSILTVSIAAYQAFIKELEKELPNAKIDAMAGFSMGEYAALTVSKVIEDFDTTLSLIKKRGQFMTEAGLDDNGEPKGAMAAAFGDRVKIINCVNELKENNILECVNYNSPLQTAVAGDIVAIERLQSRAKSEFGIKVKTLSVSSAFHSSMMNPAAEQLKKEVKSITFSKPDTTVYSNITGKNIMENKPENLSDSQWIANRLALQIKSPVYWQETIENMKKDGIDIFVEVGPGKTLTSFVKKIIKDAIAFHVEDKKSMISAITGIKEVANER